MVRDRPTWGIVSMVRGSTGDILRFAAHHLDLGLDRMYIYLDEPNPDAFEALRQHPAISVQSCDDAYWRARKRNRPEKHQLRQTLHATYTYRNTDLDWLSHIDLDEFLWPSDPIPDLLRAISPGIPAVRMRPIEAIAGAEDLYKAHIPKSPQREALVETLYPNYGGFVLGGFLSHVQGKLFVRTGLENLNYRIHNLFQNKKILPVKTELPQIELCHRHAPDWDQWRAHLRFRLARGSYQAGMTPNVPRDRGGLNMHEVLSWIETEDGTDGLRAFYNEMSGADPQVRMRLEDNDLIRHRPLNLDQKVAKHFPGTV